MCQARSKSFILIQKNAICSACVNAELCTLGKIDQQKVQREMARLERLKEYDKLIKKMDMKWDEVIRFAN